MATVPHVTSGLGLENFRPMDFCWHECTSVTSKYYMFWSDIYSWRKVIYVRRWADKFYLHCNIFIYIRHIWIKQVLCGRMVSLFHHTSPWTHRSLQSSPSAHQNGRVFRRSVQRACCYWILNRGKSSSNWNSRTNASRLWWSLCRCEYGKTLSKVGKRWRIGAGWLEWQNTKWKACDCKWWASSRSRWRNDARKSSNQTKRNCRCIRNF